MINETIILLTQFEDCSKHRLAKHMWDYLVLGSSRDQYFYKPFQKIFSKVIAYDAAKRMVEVGIKGINEEIINLVRKEHPKYLLWLPVAYEFRESTFDIIRNEGSIVVGWFGDDETRFDNYSKWWIPHLAYCVTKTSDSVLRYQELGARAIQAIPCTGIAIDRDWANTREKYDVSFVGANIHNREQYINELKSINIAVHLAGKGWGGFIPYEEMIDIYKTSKINLNFSRTDDNKLGIKGRMFEVCLAGGFLLTEYLPEIESYFEIDKEIVCFHNAEEMIDKVIYYLNNDEERRAIARAGWERATNEHSSSQVAARIFREIEEDVAEKGKSIDSREIRMPRRIRKNFSGYYLKWGMAFLLENYNSLGKDALALSRSYNPLNIPAWFFYIIGFFPSFIRSPLFKLYKPYTSVEKLYMRLRSNLLRWTDYIPYLRDAKRSIARRFYYT